MRQIISRKDCLLKPKQIILTGSEGYIGTNFQKYMKIHAPDVKIRCLDKKLGDSFRAEFIHLQTGDDAIVHLAALPGVKDCEKNYEQAIIDNISTAFRAFDLSCISQIPVVFASSQAAKHIGTSKYADMKIMCEIQAQHLNQWKTANIRILRFCNLFGGQGYETRKNTVICKFLKAQREHAPLIVNGAGKQKRDFIHVDDVCEAIWKCVLTPKKMLPDVPIDIGTGKGVSILDITKMFPKGTVVENNYLSKFVGPNESIADTKLAAKYLKFKAKPKLKKYIKKNCLHS
jgi:nucleoside-diphosphate-sugar epimerase